MRFLIIAVFLLSSAFAQTSREIDTLYELQINSSINPSTLSYLKEAYKKTSQNPRSALLIKMNTPGGLVSTTKEILTLLGEGTAPVIIWVTPEGASATSAGAIISSSAHLLFMSEGTNIGAATPIQIGKDIEKDARSKAVNDLVALTSSLSEARGRNSKAFAQMISNAASYKSKEAFEKGIINSLANKTEDIISFSEGKKIKILGQDTVLTFSPTFKIEVFEMDKGQKLLNILADPSLAYILFLIGAALLYFEMQAPGGFISGSIGVLFLIFAGLGFQVLPLNWGALGLIILSFILFFLEVYITSYGILTIAAIASLVSGSLFLYRSDEGLIVLEKSLIFSSVSGIGVLILLIIYVILKDKKQNQGDTQFFSLVNKTAEVVEFSEEKEGHFYFQVKIGGTHWKARSLQKYRQGDFVKIIKQDNTNLILELEPHIERSS